MNVDIDVGSILAGIAAIITAISALMVRKNKKGE